MKRPLRFLFRKFGKILETVKSKSKDAHVARRWLLLVYECKVFADTSETETNEVHIFSGH